MDNLAEVAEKLLARGSARADLLGETRTLTIGPHERAFHPIQRLGYPSDACKPGESYSFAMIPALKIAGRKKTVWGPPTIVGGPHTESGFTSIVVRMHWD